MISLYTFLANIDDADNTEESAEDITAADTAPNPKNATKLKSNFKYYILPSSTTFFLSHLGVRYLRTIGNIIRVSSLGIGTVLLCNMT